MFNLTNKMNHGDQVSYLRYNRIHLFKSVKNTILLQFVINKVFHYLYYYPTSFNINYFWNLGFCSAIFYAIQVLSGFILTFHYAPNVETSFDSIQFIMREVNYGWLYRYVHCNCCSFFFMFVYLHMVRSLVTTSFSYPRNNVWFSGVIIYLIMMASAFFGYVLPWGQMSYWAASVITNLVGSIPILGSSIAYMIWGGYGISNDTLVRFYSIHYILPLVLAIFVLYHIYFLHFYKSSNPLGIYSVSYMRINFYPYFWIKDIFSLCIIFFVFFFILFYYPEMFNHSDNYIEANPLVTPHHIVPEWYLLPSYGILKSFTNRLVGIIFMFGSILSLCLLFIVDFGQYKRRVNYRYNSLSNQDFIVSLFVINYIYVGYLGMLVSSDYTHHFGLILSHLHFFYIYLLYTDDEEYVSGETFDRKALDKLKLGWTPLGYDWHRVDLIRRTYNEYRAKNYTYNKNPKVSYDPAYQNYK